MSKENDEEEINRVLEFLKNNQDFAYSIQEISKKVGIVEERAEQVIEYLSDYGFIVGRVLDEVTYYMYLEIKVQKFTQDKQMELFGYDCPSGYTGHDPSSCKSCPQRLEEYTVKRITVRALDQLGYKIDHIAWGSSPGADIIVTHSDKNQLILEAKGEGSRNPMRVNYFLGMLGELLQRMDDPKKHYGIVLPAYKQFVGLIMRLPTWIKSYLGLYFFLVKRDLKEANRYEVGYRIYQRPSG